MAFEGSEIFKLLCYLIFVCAIVKKKKFYTEFN